MKYWNGKEFYFLATPPQQKETSLFDSKFKNSKKLKILQKLKNERHKKFVKNMSEGLNLLEWLQKGKTGDKSSQNHPIKITFPMGFQDVVFEGHLKGISLEGQGRYQWLQGCLEYRGEIRGGLRHGRGLLVLKDPFIFFKGNFENGLKEGKGLLVHCSQNIFKGFFKKGLRQGFGIMAYVPEQTPIVNFEEISAKHSYMINRKKRKAQKFTRFFKPLMRKSLGSNLVNSDKPAQKNLLEVIQILVRAITKNQLDEQNELKGIVLGVKKKDSLRMRWSDGVLLQDGRNLNFKDQTLKDDWKGDLYVGNWR